MNEDYTIGHCRVYPSPSWVGTNKKFLRDMDRLKSATQPARPIPKLRKVGKKKKR